MSAERLLLTRAFERASQAAAPAVCLPPALRDLPRRPALVLGTGRAIRDRVKQNLNEVTTPPKVRISPPTQSGKRVAAPPRNDTLAEAEREIEAMLEDDRRARRENKR